VSHPGLKDLLAVSRDGGFAPTFNARGFGGGVPLNHVGFEQASRNKDHIATPPVGFERQRLNKTLVPCSTTEGMR
jgi:hypothetical protein